MLSAPSCGSSGALTSYACDKHTLANVTFVGLYLYPGLRVCFLGKMSVFHDEIEIEDFEYDEDTETFYFPCPCGDRFAITKVRRRRLAQLAAI